MKKGHFIIKVKPVAILAFFLVALLVRPSGMGDLLSTLNTPVKYLQILSAIIIAFFTIIYKRQPNLSLVLLLAYYVLVFGVSYFIKKSEPMFAEACSCIALSLFSYLAYEKHGDDLIEGYSKYYLFIIVIQMIMTIFGFGLYERAATGLFSNRNHMIRFFLPGLCFTFLDSVDRKNKIWTVSSVLYAACFTYLILFGASGTGKMAYLAFAIPFILFYKREIPKLFSIFNCAIYSAVVFILIYYFRIQYYLDFIIVNFLHKDPSFTKRIYIWERAISYIKENPLFGLGSYTSYANYLNGNMHAHQYWLQLLISGGFIGLILILLIYFIASKNLQSKKGLIGSTIITITIISYLVSGIDEALTHSEMLLPLLVLASMYGNSNEYFMATVRRTRSSLFHRLNDGTKGEKNARSQPSKNIR